MESLASAVTRILRTGNIVLLAIAFSFEIVMSSSVALAQSGAGSIQGTVSDSTGAVIPGAAVHVVQVGTDVKSDTKTNGVGFYQVPDLFTGTYEVTFTEPGMKTAKATVELQVAQAATINPVLTAGAVTQQVIVAADVIQLTTTDNGTISATLESSRIDQLPMNGRLLGTLVGITVPGMETGGRLNGLMPEATEYVQDGTPLSDRQFGGAGHEPNAELPDPDTIQEVKMVTTNGSAQYAAPGTGIITTKSGTNSLHGTFFETARNNGWGIAKARQDPSNLIAPHLVRNEFGASAGGPIILPKVYHGKDKSFWFFAFERYSLREGTNNLYSVPTPAMVGGDFSGLINGSGVLQQLYDPLTTYNSGGANCPGTPITSSNPAGANVYCRQPFKNDQIPIGRIASATKMLYALVPPPTNAANPLISTNLTQAQPDAVTVPTLTFRFDHSFNEKNKAYLRYTQILEGTNESDDGGPTTLASGGFPAAASGLGNEPAATFSTVLGYTHVYSPTFFSETVLSQQWYTFYDSAAGNTNLNYESMLGLPNNFGEAGFPTLSGTIMPYETTMFNYGMSQILSTIDENFTKTAGRHEMHFGGRYRFERFGLLVDRHADTENFGAVGTGLEDPSSGTSYTALANTGYAEGDFFLGSADSYEVTLEPPYAHLHDMEYDAYFQDNFHVSKNFTANIGLRYEAHPAAWIKDGLNMGFDLKNNALVLDNPTSFYVAKGYTSQAIITNMENLGVVFETPAVAGYPSTIMKNYDFTFGPRVGLAYQPFGGKYGTVIRGGYGRYIYPVPVRNALRDEMYQDPFTNQYTQSYVAAAQAPDGLPNYELRTPQTIIMGSNSSGVVNSSTINAILPGITLWNMDPKQAPDYVTQTNFTIEQSLKGNSALRLSWLWSHGQNLDHYYYYNEHPSTFTWEMNTGTALPTGTYASTATGPYDQTKWSGSNNWNVKDGWSNENALQVNYQKLFHHGVAYQVMYVWAKDLRFGGNTFRDSNVYTAQSYLGANGTLGTMTSPYGTVVPPVLPPPRPAGIAPYADWHALSKYEGYLVYSAMPYQHIQFNGIVDLPFGRGKRFLGSSNRIMDELVGGFQLAGSGNIISQDQQPLLTNYGPTSPIKVYKHSVPITDCRSGVCLKEFEWFNGYLAPTVLTPGEGGTCTSNCVTGLPSNYVPYQTPIDNTPGTTYYGKNEVSVTLANGKASNQTYAPGPIATNPFSNTFINGPINWTMNLSLFKVFPITERMNLRFNVDAFNALNMQGYNEPSATDGTESLLKSANSPRQLQLTMRLSF